MEALGRALYGCKLDNQLHETFARNVVFKLGKYGNGATLHARK